MFTNGHNVKDPMNQIGSDQERALFEAFNEASKGRDYRQVSGAALNLFVNAVRQSCPTRQQAERVYDEMVGRAKNLLLEQHYDPVTNKRRNVFPHTQVVQAELVHWNDKFNKKT